MIESAGPFTGELLFGWGAFNLLEGVVDHHLLGIHHVRDMPVHAPIYGWLFLGVTGLGLMALCWCLMSTSLHRRERVRARALAP